jgi:dolichyl-phosphate beta-glucosyltransferase
VNNVLLSIVIPCYQEEKRLPDTLNSLLQFLDACSMPFEIILVVEPSKDKTLEVANTYKNKRDEIRIIENEKRLGKGGTVQKGMLQSRGNFAMFMDADGSTDYHFILSSLSIFKSDPSYKAVIASRYLKDSVIAMKQTLLRQLLSYSFRSFVRIFLSLPYHDTQCGCKMFEQSAIQSIFENINEKGFAFDIEILLKAEKNQLKVKEIPCKWTDHAGSTVRPVKDGLKMLKSVLRLKIYKKRGLL